MQLLETNFRRLWIILIIFTIEILFSPISLLFLSRNHMNTNKPRYLTDKYNVPLIFYKKEQHNNWMLLGRRRRLNTPTALDYANYPNDEPILVITTLLLSNHTINIDKLCRALESLRFLKGDVKDFPTPILVFNDGSLSNFQLENIVQSITDVNRPIAFPVVTNLYSLPEGFVRKYEEQFSNSNNNTNFEYSSNESKWSYQQMSQFWVSTIWKHPALAPFEFIMRMDFDTCFHEDNNHLPDFAKLHKAYHAQYVGVEPNTDKVEGLFNFATNYMTTENVLPTNPLQWQLVTNTWVIRKTLPLYQASLEVIRKSFMQHPDVMKFHEAVATKEPYGIFEYGWSDHVLRFIDTAMFVSNENFMTTEFKGFSNRQRCDSVGGAASTTTSNIADLNKLLEKDYNNKVEHKEEQKLEEITIKENYSKVENQHNDMNTTNNKNNNNNNEFRNEKKEKSTKKEGQN